MIINVSEAGKTLLEMTLFCKALPLSRPRFSGNVWQPLANQKLMRSEMLGHVSQIIDCQFWLTVHAFYSSQNKSDLDNVVKAVADNLTFCKIIKDDRLMKGITATSERAEEDFTIVKISEVKNATARLSI